MPTIGEVKQDLFVGKTQFYYRNGSNGQDKKEVKHIRKASVLTGRWMIDSLGL